MLADDLVVSSTKLAKSGIDLRYFHVGPTYLGQPWSLKKKEEDKKKNSKEILFVDRKIDIDMGFN